MLSICSTWLMLMAMSGALPQEPTGAQDLVRIEGSVELSPSAAEAAARTTAFADLQAELERRANATASLVRPIWLPDPVAQHLAALWVAKQDAERALTVVDRSRKVRDHGSFESYQTTLSVRHDARTLDRMFASLPRELKRRGLFLGAIAGGSLALWGLLVFAYGWLDRVTRGYMPWRLRLVCGGMALALPALALLIV